MVAQVLCGGLANTASGTQITVAAAGNLSVPNEWLIAPRRAGTARQITARRSRASESRLLLIGTCRPTPRRPEVQELRAAVIRHGGAVVTLGPLTETDVTALVTAMLGSPPGDTLRQLTAQAAGNPLYVRELVDAMVREQALEIGPAAAEVSAAGERLPASLAVALMNLGTVEAWSLALPDAERHLREGATRARLGMTGEARAALAAMADERAGAGEIRNARAVVCLAEGDPAGALSAVREVLDGTAPVTGHVTVVEAQLLAGLAHRGWVTGARRISRPNGRWLSPRLTGWCCRS
jgi:hypothetical protein